MSGLRQRPQRLFFRRAQARHAHGQRFECDYQASNVRGRKKISELRDYPLRSSDKIG